mmetsp:Transcript_62645/g.104260  ORF Transcript_62645/g.104260 Transcript_62645/m.104260 type:complete len:116 (-) Transcript_62645:1152-1499(-)
MNRHRTLPSGQSCTSDEHAHTMPNRLQVPHDSYRFNNEVAFCLRGDDVAPDGRPGDDERATETPPILKPDFGRIGEGDVPEVDLQPHAALPLGEPLLRAAVGLVPWTVELASTAS